MEPKGRRAAGLRVDSLLKCDLSTMDEHLLKEADTTSLKDLLSGMDMCKRLRSNPFTLRFKSPVVENDYLLEVASGRVPVFIAICSFDLILLFIRLIVNACVTPGHSGLPVATLLTGIANLFFLYSLIALVHWRSKHSGTAASLGELLLAALISGVLCLLLTSSTANTWIFAAFFLICTSTVLRLRWLVGAVALAIPVVLSIRRNLGIEYSPLIATDGVPSRDAIALLLQSVRFSSTGALPVHAIMHLVVAWAAGTLMGYLSDSSRRQSFASHRLALSAAATEVEEVRARVAAERELASAQALAQAKSLLVDRERASNEAKSEFISMLCHEIRTPLNGCLASAEMLLQTDLDDDQKDLAHTIRVSGAILLSTVSNFLDFFKLEAGKSLDIVRTPVDLPMMVTDVHRIIEAMVGSGEDLALRPPNLTAAPSTVLGDPSRLCGILLNMYMNAAKFTKRGSIGVKVKVVNKDYTPSPPLMEMSESGLSNGSSSSSGSDEDQFVMRGNLGVYQIRHDSADSLPRHLLVGKPHAGAITSHGTATGPSSSSTSGAREINGPPGPMTIADEGNGWLSTSSAQHTPTAEELSSQGIVPGSNVQWVCFEVHDTGVGIAPKSLSSLFRSYVQGDAAEMEKPRTRSGTGLGLAICGKQVMVLGGVIGALSKPGTGSVFWFKVPMLIPEEGTAVGESGVTGMKRVSSAVGLKKVGSMVAINRVDSISSQDSRRLENTWTTSGSDTGPASDDLRSPKAGVSASTLAASSTPAAKAPADSSSISSSSKVAGLRVLVAEDNMINRKVACRVLQSLGIECETACNGQEAVDVVAEAASGGRRIDAVLMDMCMPVMGGVEATRSIRALGSTIPIVAMTANALDKDKEECLASGMNGFLSKPVLREQLAACILEACGPGNAAVDCEGGLD